MKKSPLPTFQTAMILLLFASVSFSQELSVSSGDGIILSKDSSAAITSFTAKNNSNKVYLKWTVVNQKMDGTYIIYRSSDSVNYEPIGTKTGVGVPISKAIAYYFTDEAPSFSARSYYRIIHIAKNQTFLSSEKIMIDNDKQGIAAKTL